MSYDFEYNSEGLFPTELPSHWSINMVKVLSPDFSRDSVRLPCYLSKGALKEDYLDIYLTTFLESVSSKLHQVWGSSFFSKCSKWKLYFENSKRKSGNNFYFWDNSIWRCCYKLSLLRTEYFSSAVNVLTNSPKILHITKRNFFQLNCLHSDQ